jgi:hypothetical protein
VHFTVRKALTGTLLSVMAAVALPSVTATASSPTTTASDNYCLANTWNTPEVRTRGCDNFDRGQHWTVRGAKIHLTEAPGYCLANTWGTPEVRTRGCDDFDRGQHWTVSGERISLTHA